MKEIHSPSDEDMYFSAGFVSALSVLSSDAHRFRVSAMP